MRVVASNKRGLEGFTRFCVRQRKLRQVGNITHVEDGRSLLLKWEQPSVPNGEVNVLFFGTKVMV